MPTRVEAIRYFRGRQVTFRELQDFYGVSYQEIPNRSEGLISNVLKVKVQGKIETLNINEATLTNSYLRWSSPRFGIMDLPARVLSLKEIYNV